MGRARTTNLLYFLKCNNLVFLKTQRAAHSLFPEKVSVLEAAAPCRTAGPLARGAGGRARDAWAFEKMPGGGISVSSQLPR